MLLTLTRLLKGFAQSTNKILPFLSTHPCVFLGSNHSEVSQANSITLTKTPVAQTPVYKGIEKNLLHPASVVSSICLKDVEVRFDVKWN